MTEKYLKRQILLANSSMLDYHHHMKKSTSLGERIQKLRESRKITLEELSERSGCSVELLTCLERGEVIPSLAPLFALARGLGVRLGTFLDDEIQSGPVLTRAGNFPGAIRFAGSATGKAGDGTLNFYSLGADKRDRHMEPFYIEVHPKEGNDSPGSHEGEEFLYVLQGVVELIYGKERYRLEAGDSIYYDSVVPHEVRAADDGGAKMVAVVYAPV